MEDDSIDPSVYRYVLKHTKKDQIILLLLTAISMPLVYGVLELPKLIINQALNGENIPEVLFGYPMDQVKYLFVLCTIFFVLIFINSTLNYLYSIYRGLIGERMLKRFRFELYSRILRFPIPRFKQISQAEIIPLITAETQPLGNWIGNSFALPVFQGGLLITYLVFIFNQDVWLGLAAIALYPPQLLIIPKIQKYINKLDKERVQTVRQFSDRVGESVSGIYDIHTNDMSRYEKSKVTSKLSEIYDIRLNIVRGWFLIRFLNTFLGQLTPFLFYAIGGYFVIKGDLSVGALVAVLAAYKDLDTSWRDLLSFYQITENVRVRYGQIVQFFDPGNMLLADLQAAPLPDSKPMDSGIQLTTLSYSEDAQVKSLDGVSLQIESGERVGLLGQTGSGRSALAQLIARLIHPTSGTIRIAENDVENLTEGVLGKKIGYVDQQSFVFNCSVRDNLFYGLKNDPAIQDKPVMDDRVLSVLEKLKLDQDILDLGLKSCIDPSQRGDLAAMVLDARGKLSRILEQGNNQNLVDTLNPERYNTSMSVAENLLFGVPKQVETTEELLAQSSVDQIIEQTGLKKTLFHIGLKTSRVIVDMFFGMQEGNPMFSQFDFIKFSELPKFEALANLPEDIEIDAVSSEHASMAINVSFKLTVSRHRLGMITEEIQKIIVDSHLLLRQKLGEVNDVIEFYDKNRVAQLLSVQDNILFGRIVYGQASAQQKVTSLINQVVSDSGHTNEVIDVGLDFEVGVGGSKLTSKQRQKITLARAVIKNPDILVVNDATTVFEKSTEQALLENILELMNKKTIIWVLDNQDYIERFDKLIVLEQGKIVFEGSAKELKQSESINVLL